MGRYPHIVNVSGGKDSTATYLLAVERGVPFRAVMADTGHEHDVTYEYAQRLSERTGGPPVEMIRADFSEQMARKRRTIEIDWTLDGVSYSRIERAKELLHPTGNVFLDLCLWKGRFPGSHSRFCTEYLKVFPLEQQVLLPALREHGGLIRWQGERREESPSRSQLPIFQRVRWTEPKGTMLIYRPIVHWKWFNVFDWHWLWGLPPNPLYSEGMGRVGCFPCILAKKSELRAIAARFPEAVERVKEMEMLVAETSKRGQSSFFAANVTTRGRRMLDAGNKAGPFPDAREVMLDWAFTKRGGTEPGDYDEGAACSSVYGLCE